MQNSEWDNLDKLGEIVTMFCVFLRCCDVTNGLCVLTFRVGTVFSYFFLEEVAVIQHPTKR